MELETIQSYIAKGYELVVRSRALDRGKFHAFVHLGHVGSTHNYVGATPSEALEGLERYLQLQSSAAGDGGER